MGKSIVWTYLKIGEGLAEVKSMNLRTGPRNDLIRTSEIKILNINQQCLSDLWNDITQSNVCFWSSRRGDRDWDKKKILGEIMVKKISEI